MSYYNELITPKFLIAPLNSEVWIVVINLSGSVLISMYCLGAVRLYLYVLSVYMSMYYQL